MQQVLATQPTSGVFEPQVSATQAVTYCFTGFWDSKNARFQPCFLPIISVVPALIAVVILLGLVAGLLLPLRPGWTKPFVEEPEKLPDENEQIPTRRWTNLSTLVAWFSLAGFTLSIATVILVATTTQLWPRIDTLAPMIAWLIVASLAFIQRSRTAPISILVILVVQLIAESSVLANKTWPPMGTAAGLNVASIVIMALEIFLIHLMPLRDPHLPGKEISEAFSEPTSSLRSPEECLTLWQFMSVSWMTPLIGVGNIRQLQDEDVWQLAHEFQHAALHINFRQLKGTVIRRLIKANAIDLVILTFLGLVELTAQYSVPVLLQQILAAMENPKAPKQAAITYAGLSLVVRLVACQSGIFSLWFGRRCYERSRGEMITMLYEKTLGRKISFQQQESKTETGDTATNSENSLPKKEVTSYWTQLSNKISSFFSTKSQSKVPDEPASMGKILNLMRNDVYEVAQRFWEFQGLITKPLSAVFSIALVIHFLGWSSMIAVVALLIAQILNFILARVMIHFEKKRRAATDKKLQVITQFIEAIRHLRWYGWQDSWLVQIMDARMRELNLRVITSIWVVLISFVNTLALDLTPVLAFFAYTVISGKPLTVDIAFPAMQLFSMMTAALRDLPSLIIVIINAWVAVDRIESFMAEPDREEMSTEALIGDRMSLDHATFAWPGVGTPVLKDINLSFPVGLTVVCGEVASGKTALLQSLLGELDKLEGQLIKPSEAIGYCAQTPWLQSMSIRENILFSMPYSDKRYKDVLDACALTPDLAEFTAGDLSLIGENGIGLSGGQRARVALARAVYSDAKILLLDDPLSALDQQTAELIVRQCLSGPLLQDRTTILVTHRTDLVLGIAEQVIKLENGTAAVLQLDTNIQNELQRVQSHKSVTNGEDTTTEDRINAAVPEKFIEDEHRAHGSVKAQVYWEYIKAGKLRWWTLLIIILAIYRSLAVFQSWFLKVWGEAYETQPAIHYRIADEFTPTVQNHWFSDWPSPSVDIKPWLMAFFWIALSTSLVFFASQAAMIVIVYIAAKGMFQEVMKKVAYATFRFYDVTPVGRLMNRMTSDIAVIDGNISMQFQAVTWMGISWISSIVIIGSVTPTFLAFAFLLTGAFVSIFLKFLPTSQSLRRLEMVSLTPLMSNFGALLNGLTTVRAFCAQDRFQDRVIRVVDTFQKMDHFYWSLQAWLMYRFDSLSALSTFLLTMLALVTNVSPGLTAFVLLAADQFVSSTHGLCKQYGQLQMEFVSVERVVELLRLEQEPKGHVAPPAWWPSFTGEIVFKDVTIKYAPHLDPALSKVSFSVKGGSKTAIIGRTGSGKSTLALAMLATILPEIGSIFIDSVDLADVDKQLLRTRITFLAQDPVLFPGTMRQNLDPVNEHTDAACATVLHRVCERQGWKLETRVEAGGRNLSQGQRQLVGLARAVLRRSAIIILDEATASIDKETAMQIQQVMHEEMKDSTVITIAHRLEAVRNADYCIVLGKGKVLEQGPAEDMLREHRDDMVEHPDDEEE
ncbi:ABC bile acid transporter [Acrodontium crateriforme]|uniref:ABC bile acid transporter n=1 Tax=Acrodontium crateriforme TaxID=150365 RepID=A0AAQ3M274_9PEZI|nr:ABC bile acid transporter [Acrodontium crateriforme]